MACVQLVTVVCAGGGAFETAVEVVQSVPGAAVYMLLLLLMVLQFCLCESFISNSGAV